MRKLVLTVSVVVLSVLGFCQNASVQQINGVVTPDVALEPLHYLASDKLMGRSPKRPEINIAASYLADEMRKFGVRDVEGAKDYFQNFELKMLTPPGKGTLTINNTSFEVGENFLHFGGKDISVTAPVIFAGFGSKEELDKLDLKGKIVVTNFGINDTSHTRQGILNMNEKQKAVSEKGGVALVERFWQKDVPWTALQGNFSRERAVQNEFSIPVLLLNADSTVTNAINASSQATLSTNGNAINSLAVKNVIGWVEGTDPKLKDQIIVLSAHYDHLGVAPQAKMIEGKMDSIFNGARDNAIGVTAVLNAARYFAKHPPKRSVMFIFFTAEEMGLLGSRYYADHSVVPLKKIVYDLNCDNGGYNDTTIVTVVGLGRTSADDDITNAARAYGVRAISDPVPELNLFDRSDNVNFAIKGVPAPTFGMGVTAFDSVVQRYYHQLSDEVSSFNLRYAMIYIRSYILAAKNIADNKTQPTWKKNDKYEAAWKKLYTSTE